MNQATPFVRVIVLAYDGADMTLECLGSLFDSNWPSARLEVVLVDNGSLDDVASKAKNKFPQVRLLEPMKNLGFAGGCNLGIVSTRCSSGEPLHDFDYVALINNDATVDPGWLSPLVETLEAKKELGAASPKMLFTGQFFEVEISPLFPESKLEEDVAVCLTGVRINGARSDERVSFDEGFGGPDEFDRRVGEEFARWTTRGGRVRIRCLDEEIGNTIEISLRIGARVPGKVLLRSDLGEFEYKVGPQLPVDVDPASWIGCEISGTPFNLVNNVGSELYKGGSAGDRGFLERDTGQFGLPARVFAWCGGAVLLRKAYLDTVGLLDESFFLYYEDTDLAWRGQLLGWQYMYVPGSIVHHRHAQSSVVGSDLFRFQVERNRLLVLAKNAPASLAIKSGLGEVRRLMGTVWSDLIWSILRFRLPSRREVRLRWSVLRSYLHLLPSALRSRWSLRAKKSRRKVMSMAIEKQVPYPRFSEPTDKLPQRQSGNGSDRPKVAIYNLYWGTLGGGEVVSGELAGVLSDDYDVTLLGPHRPDVSIFAERMGIDLSMCDWREVADDEAAGHESTDFDIFINCTYSSRARNRAPIGLYYVHFPRKLLPRSKEIALENGIRLAKLAARSPLNTSKFATAERIFREHLGDDSWVASYTTFIANSNYTRRWIENIWHRDSEVINPPVRPRVIPGDKEHLIASVGRFFDPSFGHSKKQMEMLTIFADMVRSQLGVDDWRLIFLGGADAPSRDYVMRIRRAAQGLPIDVHVNADRIVVDDALSRASIYWHASGYDEDEHTHPDRLEHFGISIVEAMAAGAVPLVFGAGGPAEIVRNGVDGFHWHTLEQLAQLTRRLMNDESQLESMSRAARERAKEFDPTVFDQRIHDLVRSLRDRSQTR